MAIQKQDRQRLADIYGALDAPLLRHVRDLLGARAPAMIEALFADLMRRPENASFLAMESVTARLKTALAGWLDDLFQPRGAEAIDTLFKRQAAIGAVHARMNVPLASVTRAAGLLKEEIFRCLIQSDLERERLADAVILADKLIDAALSAMNDVYLDDLMASTRQSQALKMQSLGTNLALQCERLKSSLLDWWRQTLAMLLSPKPFDGVWPAVRYTDFGLWVSHKAALVLSEDIEVSELQGALDRLDTDVREAFAFRQQGQAAQLAEAVARLDSDITVASRVLGEISQRTLVFEGSRDPLTRLFNRRFMTAILQRETELSLKSGRRFALLMIDIDHFKRVNDQHGHAAGDRLLTQLSDILTQAIRAGDFVFRYGGEEFLVVLGEVDAEQAWRIGEKIRLQVMATRFQLGESEAIGATVSVGVALHDGHPDFSRVIEAADAALLVAKASGRNQVHLAQARVAA
ncbi:MAG: GGDEF domain-containing protein [Rhodospirillales bacterium]|nr:GGDEF domain-containing protein [Rhodospirillales bacterium]